MKRNLKWTLVIVALEIVAASVFDYLVNVVIFPAPGSYTPLTTLLITGIVGAPTTWLLVSQRSNLQSTRERLSAIIAEKDQAVTESRERRREAERALERLGQSEALYRLLADNQTDVISLWTSEGERRYTSPSSERAFGYTADEMMTLPRAANAHPDDLPVIRAVTQSLEPGGEPKTAEYRLTRKDGTVVWVEATFQRLNDGGGGLLTTTRLIDERKRLQQELIQALDEANTALSVKSDFLANMTHELRTPLNAIIGFSGLLRQSDSLNPRDARHVKLICDAGGTLLHVINDVLDYSKLEAGAIELERQPFDPHAVAESIAQLLAAQAADKGLTLSVAAEGSGGLLLGDSARLRQVLLNFVSNAVKFTARGGVEIKVSQHGEGGDRNLRVEVRDTGIGIHPEQLDSIFGRFTQADASTSRQFGGTGLGLAICKRIGEAMGGRIGVHSTVGQGSTFWIEATLPAAGAADGVVEAGDDPTALERPLRLLLVEDNAVNRELVSSLLTPFDILIETAADGVEAVEAAARAAFDVILMDVQMPNMDGLTATRRIRAAAVPGGRRVPIIAMTANVLPEQVARCREAGMDDHLGKPISPAKLLEALGRWSAEEPEADAGQASAS